MTNLNIAFGDTISEQEKKSIIQKAYKNLLIYLSDFIYNTGISKDELLKKVNFENRDIVDRYKDKNIIFITAHYGNWELLSLAIGAFIKKITIVGRDLDSQVMQKILKHHREQFDIELVSKKGAIKNLIKAINNNRTIGLLVDQNTSDRDGIIVNFFGKEVRHTPTAMLLANKFDAVVIPAFITTDDYKNYTIRFYEPVTSTQEESDIIERVVREKPEEWFWFHRRWKNRYSELYLR
jgi:KDO2-lipid IV(A) lauroyltransferase